MAAAFLPWEKWIARLLHPIAVAVRRWLYKVRRKRLLSASEGWPEVEGSVVSIGWDSSFPREEIVYSYSMAQGYYSGSHWLWFDPSNAREVRIGDRIVLRYGPQNPEKS